MLSNLAAPEATAAVVVSLTGIAYGLQKLLKGWKSTATEVSLIELMHKELDRMATQNHALSTELNKLQRELMTLNVELQKLTLENRRLHFEVQEVTKQLARINNNKDKENDSFEQAGNSYPAHDLFTTRND